MTLKTGMLVGIVGSQDIGVLIQIRAASNSCVIKLNNGTLMKNVPLEDVEEAKDMNDTKEKKSPIRLGGEDSPGKSPAKLTALSVDIRKRSSDKIKISTLDVGDSVRARCNNGSRWFPGKILRVNRDGTYDVEYSDGDIEKKMSPADVEADVKPDKSPAVTKRSSFRLDQKVKARYKGGKKLFPGKIKRVNSDDTYDIRYEDGDEEKRVKAENIQAVSDLKADSDEDQKSVKASTGKFKVGTKVKAHYKKGKKLFSGKISRVRSDGTYDIDYDDGEVETRVEAGQIEVIDDMFADSDDDKPIVSKKKAGWEVGDRVKAYYGKGKRLFPGRISKVHMNGTYDIKYDDGDSEVRVEARLIESEEDKEKTVKLKESPKMEKHLFRVGDSVKAKYKRGSKFFPGKITRKRMDGTFDIRYEDGDVEERVEEDCIQPVVNQREDEAEKPKKKSFEVGDVVKAPFQRGNKLFRGKISRVRSDGTYDVAFDDGDKDTHVPADLIQLEESESREKSKKSSLKVGDIVKARYKKGKKLFDGKVVRVRSDGTYDIEYDDGDLETRVNIEMIEVPEGKNPNNDGKSSPKTKKSLKVGDRVRAHYNKGSKMFSGEITAVHRDGTLDIRYDDGDKEKRVEPKDVEVEEERESDKPKTSSTLHVGDTVEASYKNGVKFFPGKISRVHSDRTYDITFNDGDSERRVPPSRIKAKKIEESSSKKKKMFAVGDAIQAKYKKGSKYFPGKISRIRSDGTYDIQYEDGDSETHVDSSLIITVESETKANEDSPKPSKSKRFEVGDVVKARYKKGTKLFPGKITRVRSDGTYDIKYDDGDTEQHVKSSHIEGEAKADKEGEAFVVGDKVNARYKGGTKRFPGTIVKVRMDGTFDIEYDDGDTEQRVKGSSLELISSSKERKPQPKTSSKDDDLFGESDSDGKSKKISKKTVKIKVGDVVEANFKRKGKFHRGKVMRARSDGTLDVDYDVGASEKHVRLEDIKLIGGNQENSDDSDVPKKKSKIADKISSDTDQKPTKSKKKKKETHSSSESSGSEKQNPLNKGAKVTFRKAEDAKSRRIGTVRKIHSDGSCDVKYADGESVKRIARKLLTECSDSEDSDDEPSSKKSAKEAPSFRRHESVSSNWRRSSKLSKPKMTDKWTKATVLEKNGDRTYTIRYSDGVVEEDVPAEALKLNKKTINSDSDEKSERKRQKRKKTNGFGTESLFLLEQLSMTLFEEGVLKKKPKLQLLQGDDESSSSDSSSSESGSGSSSSKKNDTDKVFKRLFDSDTLQTYKRFFKENDEKQTGKISRSRIISIVENLLPNSSSSINHLLTEWFSTHDDLRTHRRFEFKTLLLAFAYVKSRLSKIKMEQSVATVLQGRFASYHENKRQMELWQEKLGFRLFETLQRHFHDQCLPNMIPSRIRVSEVSLIFEQVARQAVPNKPLEVYFQQQQLLMHHTLLLPEFLCCYYQLYGSADSVSSRFVAAVELRPIAFVASCLFSNGDDVCKRHGDLVRRLSVGRTPAQVDLILRFRQVFESLLSTEVNASDELLLDTSQLSSFAAQVAPDPSQLEPALTTLRKRCGAVSLVEIYGTCGFIIDELTSAPTIRNAIERMRMRVELAEVRRIIGLVRNVCVKILRFPNNADYWRIRADSEAFQQKIGRFDGATSLLEAAGFVERHKTHYELKGARNSEGKRVSALDKSTLDVLRGKCVQLDGELALFDGVESLSSILQRIAKSWTTEGKHFTMDECQNTLKNLSLYIENVLKDPKDSRCWRIREANGTFQRQIGYLPFVTELMASIGFDLVETTHGSVYSLRGTGGLTKQSSQEAASLANFTFTSVSSHMEWFLWRRKQEIDSLLEDEMKYLHDIIRPIHKIQGNPTATTDNGGDTEIQDAVLIKMYPYGGNAMETFNKTEIQRRQLDMIRNIFKNLDVAHKDFLVEADFSRAFGSSSTLPVWSQFEAFDIGNDGKIDLHDVVAALGPLLDHPYELKRDKCGDIISPLSAEENSPTVCEAASLAVGNLRLETSCSVAATGLEALLNHLFSIIQEPDNLSLRIIDEKSAISKKLLQYSSGRELLQLSGFKASGATRIYELQSQHVRFKTSKSVSELPTSLDSATLTKLQTVAAMLAGHYRGLKIPSVSDISAVSRAISSSERCSEIWARVVQLAVKCLDNIENQPENPRFREIHTATNTFSKSVGCVQGGLELLLSIGFRETDSGTLVLPMDTSLDVLKARKLELEVGLGLLRQQLSVSTNEVTKSTQKLNQRKLTERRGQSENQPAFGSREHLEMKKKILKEKAKGRPVTRQNTNGKAKIRPQSARVSDPIEKEILADFPRPTSAFSRKLTPKERVQSRKQVQRRAPRKPTSSNGHTMILATDAASGTDKIVVQKGEFVLRGACIRIGAEIRDLCEERMVIQASNDHTPGLTTLQLGIPLRFFHPAKELVATILLPSAELAKRLQMSDTQVLVRDILYDIIADTVEKASIIHPTASPVANTTSTLVTSFEPMATLPILSSNVRIGPMLRYVSSWSGSEVSVFIDELSDRKLVAYWEGLVFEGGNSNETISAGALKRIIRRNAYLSLLLSTAQEHFDPENDDIQLTFQDFREIFRLPPPVSEDYNEENEHHLQLPFSYLKRHFQVLALCSTSLSSGFKAVSVIELVRRVGKDIIDHPPDISDDPIENQTALDQIYSACQHLEKRFTTRQTDPISWPELVYFIRYNQRLTTPEMFPTQKQLAFEGGHSKNKEVAEVVAGLHSSRLLILFYDGSVDVWNIESCNAILESRAHVLFSSKSSTFNGKKGSSDSNSFMQAWMDANQTNLKAVEAAQRTSKRIRQFKRLSSQGNLVHFCAWDSILCVNSSILEEKGSGSFRFFRLVRNFVGPLRQVTVEKATITWDSLKKKEEASSSGTIRSFQVTVNGTKVVFLTGSETILWVSCAVTGEMISHVDLQIGRFRALFQISETKLPTGEIETQLYAMTSAESYRYVRMWVIPQKHASITKKRTFNFGKTKKMTVVDLSVADDLLFVASKDGSIAVWSTATDESSSISPLICLRIPRCKELHSIWCQSLRQTRRKPKIRVEGKEINKWEAQVLQQMDPPPLRFALYLFQDGEVIHLAISDRFDARLVTLDDSEVAYEAFVAPVSGVKQNPARRVVLQYEQVIRVVFIALQHVQGGVFAQKSVQGFFTDLDIHEMLWKCHDDMVKFALSYQENLVAQLKPFYRDGDGEQIELTPPQLLKSTGKSKTTLESHQDVVIGAVLKAAGDGNETQFQTWKFAMNRLSDDTPNDVVSGQIENARQSLALQSSYRFEAERIIRIRDDLVRQDVMKNQHNKQITLVRCMQDNIRNIIAQSEEATDRFLKTVNIYLLESFFSQRGFHPLEQFLSFLFNQASFNASIEVASITKVFQEAETNSHFAASVVKVIQEMGKYDWKKGVTWNSLALIVNHVQASTISSAELGSLLVDLGLTNRVLSQSTDSEYQSSSLPNFVQQLHQFLSSRSPEQLTLEATMNALQSSRSVVEFIIDSTNFSSFFQAKMADLSRYMTEFLNVNNIQRTAVESYAIQLKMTTWQRSLHDLARSQNELFPEISEDGSANALEPTAEDLQQLQRFLATPLPSVSPQLSVITLENRCDNMYCGNRFVMNATGRSGTDFLPLSVVYVFMEGGQEAESEFQQELTFLGKLKHLRARQFFLPVYLDGLNVPILPAANGKMANGSDTSEIHCIVAESLRGWSSLPECLEFMRLSAFSVDYWKQLLWFWSIRVLLILLVIQNEKLKLREGVDLNWLLVSSDGSDLRLCSLSSGSFIRFEDTEAFDSLGAKTFGYFVYKLLCKMVNDNKSRSLRDEPISMELDDNMLCQMRRQILHLFSSMGNNKNERNLSEFACVSQIAPRGPIIREGEELERLCELALLGLQPENSRPGLQSLWIYAGRPGMDVLSEMTAEQQTLSKHLTTLVGTQKLLQKLKKGIRLCWELCDDEECCGDMLSEVIEFWTGFLGNILDNGENTTTTQIFATSLGEILDNDVPRQLCGLSMRLFTQLSKRGDRDQGREAVEVLLKGYTSVLELVEANTNFDSFNCDSLLMRLVLQILNGLMNFAGGHVPLNHECSTISRFHRDSTTNAVLWRLSESFFRNLLGIEMQLSKFPMLLRWLNSRQSSFGFNPMPLPDYNGENHEITLWWDDSAPRIPHLSPSSAAEDVLVRSGCTDSSLMTAHYLRCVYETKEIEFKLTSGISVAKFRLAALQQLFGAVFLERKSCYPLVFVHPVVATVWRDLAFERFICTLLRDEDEKIVLGALSLLDCCTRVFRFDPLRSSRSGKMPGSAAFPCPERSFALRMCCQSVVVEVKRVLDKTIKVLKVLGESGASSASRSQHPLVAILCVGLAWLVNCLHGGDEATQFWGLTGIDQLIISHCKFNSLPFVKVRDSNMINQVFHKNQRVAQGQDTANKWLVFTSELAQTTSYRSTVSPFRLMLEEIVWIGSCRSVGLMIMLFLSRTFREEISAVDDRGLAFQCDLISSGDYGKVSHVIDLARDITQMNGTISEQVQVILYTKALFLYHASTSVKVRVTEFSSVFKEIWGWVDAAWQNMNVPNGKRKKLEQDQCDVVLAGFSLLHLIISHPVLLIEDVVRFTTFLSSDNDESRNVLQEVVNWIINLPIGSNQPSSVLIESGVMLLVNSIRSRSYDDVAIATIDACVGIQVLLELLEIQYPLEANAIVTVYTGDKQQIWSMLLYFDSRVVTSRILDLDFLDTAIFSRLLSLNANAHSPEAMIASLNQRLEAVMYLEVLVCAASRRGTSVNTRMLFGETCKLLLHHDIIAKETTYLQKTDLSYKHVAVCKRVMQLICCLCIDFSSRSTSRMFVAQLEAVGIPQWVVAFHQAQHTEQVPSSSDQLLTRVDLFWKDWQGREAVENSTHKLKKTLVQTAPNRQRSVFEKAANHRIQVKPNVLQLDSDEDLLVAKAKKPTASNSPVKRQDTTRNLPKLRQGGSRTRATSASIVETLLSIDAESALRLAKKKHEQQQPKVEIEEDVLDSDANSALTGSSEEEIKQKRQRAPHKSRTRLNHEEEKKMSQAKQLEHKTEQNNTRSHESRSSNSDSENSLSAASRRDRARSKAKTSHKAPDKRSKVARNQPHEALLGVFRKYDVDGDGVISFIDLRRAMDRQTKGHRLSDVEIQRWITEKDKGGQGVVSFEDFVVAFQGKLQHT